MKNQLRVFRAQRGWSQAQLADLAGVARQTIIALEGDKYAPSLTLAFKLAKLFNTTVEQLFQPDVHD